MAPLRPAAAAGAAAGALIASRASRRARPAPSIEIGTDRRRRPVAIPLGGISGSHTLIVGATGSGKTVTQTLIAAGAIEAGLGAVIIDPKGDALLRERACAAAARMGREFLEWTPRGPCTYNPYGHGSAGEIADKALAGEHYTEPHYLARRSATWRTPHARSRPPGSVPRPHAWRRLWIRGGSSCWLATFPTKHTRVRCSTISTRSTLASAQD